MLREVAPARAVLFEGSVRLNLDPTGELPEEQEALVKPKAEVRSEGTSEPAFYHSYPSHFYSELLRASPATPSST